LPDSSVMPALNSKTGAKAVQPLVCSIVCH
jgi:hypothetical protein